MQPFHLVRSRDDTGISGTGLVAEGVRFSDGTVVLRWCTPHVASSTAVYGSLEDMLAIHGHSGATRVRWWRPTHVERAVAR